MRLWLFFLILPSFLFAEIGFVEPWGKDADLIPRKKIIEKKVPPSPLTKLALLAISLRQNVLTKVDGPRSSYRPTSSRYMQLALQKYGFLKGYIMGCDRLIRENDDPWVYRTIVINKVKYKYDPPGLNKHLLP